MLTLGGVWFILLWVKRLLESYFLNHLEVFFLSLISRNSPACTRLVYISCRPLGFCSFTRVIFLFIMMILNALSCFKVLFIDHHLEFNFHILLRYIFWRYFSVQVLFSFIWLYCYLFVFSRKQNFVLARSQNIGTLHTLSDLVTTDLNFLQGGVSYFKGMFPP